MYVRSCMGVHGPTCDVTHSGEGHVTSHIVGKVTWLHTLWEGHVTSSVVGTAYQTKTRNLKVVGEQRRSEVSPMGVEGLPSQPLIHDGQSPCSEWEDIFVFGFKDIWLWWPQKSLKKDLNKKPHYILWNNYIFTGIPSIDSLNMAHYKDKCFQKCIKQDCLA